MDRQVQEPPAGPGIPLGPEQTEQGIPARLTGTAEGEIGKQGHPVPLDRRTGHRRSDGILERQPTQQFQDEHFAIPG
jgi:hypothetical protein